MRYLFEDSIRMLAEEPDGVAVTFEHAPAERFDLDGQKRALHDVYGRDGWQVPRLLAEMDAADDFYFDSISQIVMDRWTTGRVALVGDAGYSPGPAVGGGTSVAMVGAYVLAHELGRAGRDHRAGLRVYEERLRELVVRARRVGHSTMSTLIPRTGVWVRLMPELLRLVTRMPRL